MKKLFTLITAMMLFVGGASLNAKETIPNFTPSTMTFGGWVWNTVSTLGSGEAVNAGDGKADDSGITYFNASEHYYVIFEYTAATCAKMKAIVQYTCNGIWGQYGAEFNTTEVETALNSLGGIIAVKLDIDKRDKVYSIALQDPGAAGTLDLKDVYFATEEEYKAAQAEADKIEKIFKVDGEGTHTLEAGSWGWDSKWIGDTDISAYNTLVIKVKSVTGKGQLTFTDGLKVELPATDVPTTITADISSIASFNQIAYQNICMSAADLPAPDLETVIVMEEVYLTSKTKVEVDEEIAAGISNAISAPANDNAPMYNLAGQKVDNSYKGVVIKNGKKFFQK
ncbi:MAG: hypothetical protein J6C05_10720 [Prevotella sp.]|nr:hypothetical protein [Prevotella sp.]